jgi:hypothetical protein
MRKALAILLCAAACSMVAFAEDAAPTVVAKFNTTILTGATYNAGDNSLVAGDSDGWGQDASVSRFDFKGDFSYGDVGAKFTIREQPIDAKIYTFTPATDEKAASVSSLGYPFVRRAFAYANLLDKKVHLELGLPGYGAFSTSYNAAVAMDNNLPGLIVTVKPIEGLEIGYMLPISSTSTFLFDQTNASTLAVSYTIPDILTAQAWIRQFDDLAVIGDVNLTAVKDLTLSAEVEYNDAIDYSADTLYFTEQVSYPIDKFTPTIVSTQGFDMSTVDFTVFGLYPTVAYALADKLSLGVDYRFDFTYSVEDKSQTITNLFDVFVKYDLDKGYLKLRPGYNVAEGKNFFIAAVFEATL